MLPRARRPVRRAAAWLGIVALLLQTLLFATHAPASAASPVQEIAVWCGTGPAPSGPAAPSAPVKAVVCPICQTLHAAGAALLPPDSVVAPPQQQTIAVLAGLRRDSAPVRTVITAQPRAPPAVV